MDRSWRIAGQTGEGIDSTGEVFALACGRTGWHVHTFRTFPPIIKGGPTSYEVRFADRPLAARADAIDCLVALDADALDRWAGDLAPDGTALVDGDAFTPADDLGGRLLALPLTALAEQVGGRIARNMVALGASARLLGLQAGPLGETVARIFAPKGSDVVRQNQEATRLGYEAAPPRAALPRRAPLEGLLLSGNDGLGAGALAAGCRLYAAYPITPASELLEWMARHLPRFGGAVVQAEDEMAALTMVVGAGYAGIRAMTGTSGPGFSLMTEVFGLAGMTETPAVVVAEQRPGPGSGMPTGHEQADLKHAVFAGHGEFPRIVLAPGTVRECFTDAALALELAERYQTLVIVLLDQQLALGRYTGNLPEPSWLPPRTSPPAPPDTAGYRRYAQTPSGVSPRVLPGTPGVTFLTSADEHDEEGRIDVTRPEVRRRMVDKRLRKLDGLGDVVPGADLTGPAGADLLVVSYGSTGGVVDEALGRLPPRVRHARLRRLWPFPDAELSRDVARARRVVVVEQNATGQLELLLRAAVGGHEKIGSVRRYDGFPFRVDEIEAALRDAGGAIL